VASLLLTLAMLARRLRNREGVTEHWLALIAQPRLAIAVGVFQVLQAGASVLLGVGFVESGLTYGWGFFALAAAPLADLVVTIVVARWGGPPADTP
jgi:uncharacterized membrane protein YhaH (DUF805 family)